MPLTVIILFYDISFKLFMHYAYCVYLCVSYIVPALIPVTATCV